VKSEYIDGRVWGGILGSMTGGNALAIAVSLETGMRIGDVLRLKVSHLWDRSIKYTAAKTGKRAEVQCSERLIAALRANAVDGVCFPSRKGSKTPYRSRQAVWKNVRTAADRAGVKPHVSPHSARKTYAVDLCHKQGFKAVQEALQHRYGSTTEIYAFADLRGNAYDPEAVINRTYEKVLHKLSTILGVEISDEPPPPIYGEEALT